MDRGGTCPEGGTRGPGGLCIRQGRGVSDVSGVAECGIVRDPGSGDLIYNDSWHPSGIELFPRLSCADRGEEQMAAGKAGGLVEG